MSSEHDPEQVSALVDATLDGPRTERLLQRLDADPALRARWGRYHLIRDVLRGEPVVATARDVAAGVRERLMTEPVVIAPRWSRPVLRRQWFGAAAGLAVAASFGAAAVLLLPRMEVPSGQPGPAVVAAQPDAQTPWMLVEQRPVTRWHARDPAVESDLHRYLADHSEYAATGVKGPMPLATLVGYDTGR